MADETLDVQQDENITAGGFTFVGTKDDRAQLFGKLVEVMRGVDGIPKNGRHPQGYNYVSEADAADAFRAQFVEQHLALLVGHENSQTRQVEGRNGPGYITDSVFDVAIGDADSGALVAMKFAGSGMDNQDKGLAKSLTTGVKYGLMRMLLVVSGHDGDNPQPEEPPMRRSAPAQAVQQRQRPQEDDYDAELTQDEAVVSCPHHKQPMLTTFNDGNKACGRQALDGNGRCPARYDAQSGNIYDTKKR